MDRPRRNGELIVQRLVDSRDEGRPTERPSDYRLGSDCGLLTARGS